jgi:Ca-activated chloride channel family protein
MLSMFRSSLIAVFILALICSPSAQPRKGIGYTSLQSGKQQLPGRISDQTYRVSVDLVNVFCSVYDKDTKSFVTNLSREDFSIFEDGQKQEIKNFARETNQPLTIALLVDTSQSVAPKLKFEQEAATNFFYSVLKENDRAVLVEFNSAVSLLQDFTGNPNKLEKMISTLQAAGNTALYDAVVRICDEKLIRETGRKTIIILSDGEDSSSSETMERATGMAQMAEATIYSISINRGGFFGVGGDTRTGDDVLKQLASATGGKALFPFQVEDLESAFRDINQELRSQYSLGYISSNPKHDGGYRRIEIKATDRNLKLNYRKGYFAPNR